MASTSKEASASDKVLSTPELLEAILLKLPHHNVLLKQRVSKLWRDTVKTSPSIRTKLFYKCSTEPTEDEPLLNPSVMHLLKKGHPSVRWHTHYCDGKCPYGVTLGADNLHQCHFGWEVALGTFGAKDLDFEKLREASCTSMVLTDPPCAVLIADRGALWHHSHGLAIKTMGDLFGALEAYRANNRSIMGGWYTTGYSFSDQ